MGSYWSVAPGYIERSYINFYAHYITQPNTKPHSHSLPHNPPVAHTNPSAGLDGHPARQLHAHSLSSSYDLSDADY
jgi:hypothetical protein